MENDFVTWLTKEIEKRGWSNSELARRANLVPSTISMVLNGDKRPGLDFCNGVARALNHPPEAIFRLAGLLPPDPDMDPEEKEALHLFRQLGDAERKRILQAMRAWVEEK
ncbi:MAG: helix-turn-helix domain-containing protein [Anaerolineae bacterium]